ncbi:MAG TPA: SDR family oxidoreductase [Alphaproteobacteria bacterium]|nr:SDR family oxidoreductase [Alphaproteobacteria bacterium]
MATLPPGELVGRVALVTGAGRNIGRAIALALASGGASIVVNARRNNAEADAVAGEIAAAGGAALALLADVTDADAVGRMVEAAVARFGRLDILVNNAAVRRETPIDRMTLADWREILAITLDGAFNCVAASLPHLRACGAGTIVNIGGLTAHTGAKNRAHVVTAKAGLVGFTRALAHDLAGDGITVNCVAPGLIATVRGAASAPQPHHHTTHATLIGRRGLPEEVAAMVRHLCGPGGRYVTGQTLHVNGGVYFGG